MASTRMNSLDRRDLLTIPTRVVKTFLAGGILRALDGLEGFEARLKKERLPRFYCAEGMLAIASGERTNQGSGAEPTRFSLHSQGAGWSWRGWHRYHQNEKTNENETHFKKILQRKFKKETWTSGILKIWNSQKSNNEKSQNQNPFGPKC